jgi:drug/metabolite transporter (DMT)-like permease
VNPVESVPSSSIRGNRLGTGVAMTVAGGVGWGMSGTMSQQLFSAYGVEPAWLLSVRMTIAAAIFAVLVLATKRAELFALLKVPRDVAHLVAFALGGVLLCSFSYLNAIRASDAGTATVLQSLNLLIILAVTCARLHRRPVRRELVGVGLALVGTFLIATHGSFTSLAIAPAGLAWGLATAVACAIYTLLPASLLARYGSMAVTGSAIVCCAVASDVVFRPWEAVPALDAAGWLLVLGVAVVGTVLSFVLYLGGVKLVGGMLAGLLGCAEPVTACVLAAAVLGTSFAPLDVVGIVMIIAMMFLMV